MHYRTKNITLLFIWLTGLMFFMHGITPHHHHFDSVYTHGDNADNESDDSPYHCHAFNDLVIDKTGNPVNNVSSAGSNIAASYNSELSLCVNESRINRLNDIYNFKVPPEKVFLENTPARGSPVLASSVADFC